MPGVKSDRLSDHQSIIVLQRWRWVIVAISALVGLVIEAIEHFFDVDIDTWEIVIYGAVVPVLTWLLLSIVIRSIARQLAGEVELDLHQHLTEQLEKLQDWDELTRFVAKFPSRFLSVDHVSLFVYDHLAARLNLTAKWPRHTVDGPGDHLHSLSIVCMACLASKASRLHTMTTCPATHYTPGFLSTGEYCQPLKYGGLLVGALWLRLRPNEKMTVEQAAFLNLISSEIALALALAIARPQQATRARDEAQFDERRRIAQDLHNALAQQITFLNLSLDRLINRGQQAELEAFRQDLDQMRQAAGDVSEQLRNYLAVIRNWQAASLIQAIVGYTRMVTQNTHLSIDLHTDGEPHALSPQMCQQIFSLIQESLNNIQKHAQANDAQITLNWLPDALLVRVSDSGVGFDPQAIERDGHYGLAIMDEIVDELHGHFTIDSAPGRGTTVIFTIPLPAPLLTTTFETPITDATLAVASAR